MHRPIFGHSFPVLVAPVLLSVLAFNFLNKKRTSAHRNAEDVDTSASGSMATPTETNSDGSSPSPTKANNSASSSLTGNCYEVFLSFRGPDTRHSFTDHLYKGLTDAGIYAFRDDDELHEGDNIRPELLEAIRNSKILIPILSITYGTSSWCLDELVQIMDCKNNKGQIVLPIFYNVKPAEVRYQKGTFGEAFHKRKSRLLKRSSFDPQTLEKWKSALDEVSTLKGYKADGSEVELVKSIVQRVLDELKKKFELVISKNLVGIDGHMKKIMEFVDNKSHDTLFIGIHGMGGIGKTTLAKAIYNKLSNQFEHRSFIADIRESCESNGVHYLHNQLIYNILKQKDEVYNKDKGIEFISTKFTCKKVLVLLDDVDNVFQLECLAGNHGWFSSGSRIIITTRNKEVLEEARVDHNYEHEVMDNDQSLILFSKHAFRKDSPPSEFKDLTCEVVSTTGGLPLSLEVLGSLFYGKNSTEWTDIVEKLKEVLPMQVQEKLRISFSTLDYGQKQIFLDVACFFIGTDKRIASYMWNACKYFPGRNIEVLRLRSLIKIGANYELIMHDQLRDLGRTIVREENEKQPGYRSRLWDSKEALKVLKKNKGTDKIEAIDLSKGNSEGFGKMAEQDGNNYTAERFKNLTSLRFLSMKEAHLSGDFEESMEELKWLQWQECPSFEVNGLHMEELVVLELKDSEINMREEYDIFMMAEKLKYLDLSNCYHLESTSFLSAFKKLEVLILHGCRRLRYISASIGGMEALLRLDLSWCTELRELPAEIGNLKALQQLLLEETPSLSPLPDSIGCLDNLEILDISNSGSGIEELPNSIGKLRNLQELCALDRGYIYCDKLQSPPDLPSSLTKLSFHCRSRKLPSLSHLAHLKVLRLWTCESLECMQVLPLMLLKNSECSQPTDIEKSESPQSLNMPLNLEYLEVFDCDSLKTLDVPQLIHLRTLSIRFAENLLEVQGLDKLKCLERLIVSRCYSIKHLYLPEGLKILDASYCKKLAEIRGLHMLAYLESLDIEGCTSIGRLDLPKSKRLKILKAGGCKNLAEIQGLHRLDFLEKLDISKCTSIRRLLLPKSGSLEILKAKECTNLARIQGLDMLKFLKELNIIGCKSLKTIPELSGVQIYQYYEITDGKTAIFGPGYEHSDE